MRGNLEASEYKHIVLGLVFLKYISDAFEQRHTYLQTATADPGNDHYYIPEASRRHLVSESRDEYLSESVFWVPETARWLYLQRRAKIPEIGQLIDAAMDAIEKENHSLRGVLPKTYARAEIDKRLLGELVDLVGSIGFTRVDHGSDDVLGRVYEYFLGKFAVAEGQKAGAFYTPRSVVRLLVEMIEPYNGRVYDPCCGSGGMFVQSTEFVAAHGGRRTDVSIYGQESVATTWRLAKMNLAIRGIEANLGDRADDSFHRDLHPDLRADYILANPPFNLDDWYSDALRDDPRWKFGLPPASNGNFAWVQHFLYHLAPKGRAGFILGNISVSSESAEEANIRRGLVDGNVVDCIVTLPDKLFYSTPIPVGIWLLDKARVESKRDSILFIDASKMGRDISRTLRELTDDDTARVSAIYRAWRADPLAEIGVEGLCRSVPVAEVAARGYGLLPASFVISDGLDSSVEMNLIRAVNSEAVVRARTELDQLVNLRDRFEMRLMEFRDAIDEMSNGLEYDTVALGDLLDRSDERLGTGIEPEILTCTERGGLILQRERFAKRVATDDVSKYKLVRRGDIVYNPYLLWKGSIDQCWIVDAGITSPAYEVFRPKVDVDQTLVGEIVTSDEMVTRYNGISFGTVQRRRRAAPDKFLEMKVRMPRAGQFAALSNLLGVAQQADYSGWALERTMKRLLKMLCAEIR
jgi:type I restriction enzyme M protein